MATATTTIRVPRALRERLAHRADVAGTSMAGVIEHALDVEDDAEFWSQAYATMGTPEAKSALTADAEAFSSTLADGLAPEDWSDIL